MSANLATATKQPEPLPQEQKRIRLAEATGPRLFVIVKPRHAPFCYYRKDACGYTDRVEDAWKVTEEAGREYTMYADALPASEAFCDRVVLQPAPLPDYFRSLDAVASLEALLVEKDKEFGYSSRTHDYPSCRYVSHLYKITDVGMRKETVLSGQNKPDGTPLLLNTYVHSSPFETIKLVRATAAQKAEAAGLALGLWQPGQ